MTATTVDVGTAPRLRLRWPGGGRPALLTTSYVLVLLLTTLVLRASSPATVDAILQASSTDAWHLAHDPVQVLLGSALWLPSQRWWYYATVFAAFMAPLERRVGARRVLLVFLTGHVLATLLTEVPLGAAAWLGVLPTSAVHRMDVGVSYGMFTVVGACAGLLPSRRRGLVLAVVVPMVAVPLLLTHDMTSVGHALSLTTGVLWWRPLRRAAASAGGPHPASDAAVLRRRPHTGPSALPRARVPS
jgi:hypothetical protein